MEKIGICTQDLRDRLTQNNRGQFEIKFFIVDLFDKYRNMMPCKAIGQNARVLQQYAEKGDILFLRASVKSYRAYDKSRSGGTVNCYLFVYNVKILKTRDRTPDDVLVRYMDENEIFIDVVKEQKLFEDNTIPDTFRYD